MNQSSLPNLYNLVLSVIFQPFCVQLPSRKPLLRYLSVLVFFLDARKAFHLGDHDIVFESLMEQELS